MTVIDMIRMLSAEFRDMPDEDLEMWVEFVRPMVSKKLFGNLYNQALAYLVCHKMTMSGVGAQLSSDGSESSFEDLKSLSSLGFSVKSISEAGNSISFGNDGLSLASSSGSKADADLALSPYGIQFLALKKMVIVPIRISGEDTFNPL